MIDVHMIDGGKYPITAAHQRQAIKHPLIQLQEAEWIQGNIREARLRGFLMGTNPYVSWIDEDDEVLDVSWVDQAIEILENNPGISAVFPRYETYHQGRLLRTLPFYEPWSPAYHRDPPPPAHHLTIMRREHVLAIHELFKVNPTMMREPDVLLTQGMLRFGVMKPLDVIAYRWHLRPNSARLHYDPPEVVAWSHAFTSETFRLHQVRRSETGQGPVQELHPGRLTGPTR